MIGRLRIARQALRSEYGLSSASRQVAWRIAVSLPRFSLCSMGLYQDLLASANRFETGISFAEFMRVALYDPQAGYYSRPRPIGRAGDFFTSVSVGGCFGFLLAQQIRQIQRALAPGGAIDVVEQGAHDGQFTADLIEHAGTGPAWHHQIIEPNPRFREVQSARLGDGVRIIPSLREAAPLTGVYLCNELLDAFPVRRLRFDLGRWREIRIVARGDLLAEATFDLLPGEVDQWPWIPQEAADGFQTEVCPEIDPWLDDLSAAMQRGVALIIDYGSSVTEAFLPERADGSVRGYRDHRLVSDLLDRPGETDLTADVNFTQVRRAAEARGWRFLGFADQAQFLTGIAAGLPDPDRFPASMRRQFQTLVHPGIMGRRFRILGIGKDLPEFVLDGFRFSVSPPDFGEKN